MVTVLSMKEMVVRVAIAVGERYPDFYFCNEGTYEDGVIELTPEEFMMIEDATKAYVEAQRFLREKAIKAGIYEG